MQVSDVLAELRQRRIELSVVGQALHYRAPRGALTPELRRSLAEHGAELLTALRCSNSPKTLTCGNEHLSAFGDQLSTGSLPDAGELAAVKLRNTVIGDAWLVADAETLADHPDIVRSGLPIFFFDEIERLRGKTAAELKAVAMVKQQFPTGRVLQ
jgi:hypothetical protein